jgi:hypothetical protein
VVQPLPPQLGQGSCSGSVTTLPFLMRVFWMSFQPLPWQVGHGWRDGVAGFGMAVAVHWVWI